MFSMRWKVGNCGMKIWTRHISENTDQWGKSSTMITDLMGWWLSLMMEKNILEHLHRYEFLWEIYQLHPRLGQLHKWHQLFHVAVPTWHLALELLTISPAFAANVWLVKSNSLQNRSQYQNKSQAEILNSEPSPKPCHSPPQFPLNLIQPLT